MALTEQDWLDEVMYDLGLPLPGAPGLDDDVVLQLTALQGRIAVKWARFAVKALISVECRYLYTRKSALDLLLGAYWSLVDAWLGRALRISASQAFRNLQQLRKDTNDAILLEEKRARASRSPVFGEILTKGPGEVNQPTPPLLPAPGQPTIAEVGPEDPAWPGYSAPNLNGVWPEGRR